jgi:hypothetical protein
MVKSRRELNATRGMPIDKPREANERPNVESALGQPCASAKIDGRYFRDGHIGEMCRCVSITQTPAFLRIFPRAPKMKDGWTGEGPLIGQLSQGFRTCLLPLPCGVDITRMRCSSSIYNLKMKLTLDCACRQTCTIGGWSVFRQFVRIHRHHVPQHCWW